MATFAPLMAQRLRLKKLRGAERAEEDELERERVPLIARVQVEAVARPEHRKSESGAVRTTPRAPFLFP